MTISTDSYILGSSPTDTNNFLLDTDGAGALRIRRRSDGSGGLVMSINSAGIPLDKDGFDMRPLGVGQTWQSFAVGARPLGTTFTNTTGRPILVSCSVTLGNTSTQTQLQCNGVVIDTTVGSGGGSYIYGLRGVIPPGGTYIVTGGSPTFNSWSELRT